MNKTFKVSSDEIGSEALVVRINGHIPIDVRYFTL